MRLALTWRGSFPEAGRPFSAAINRHGVHRETVAALNSAAVIAAAAISMTATIVHLTA